MRRRVPDREADCVVMDAVRALRVEICTEGGAMPLFRCSTRDETLGAFPPTVFDPIDHRGPATRRMMADALRQYPKPWPAGVAACLAALEMMGAE